MRGASADRPGHALPPDSEVHDLLDRCDAYLDAVPRSAADAVPVGPFTVFVGRGSPWPYYARPARGHAGPLSVRAVADVLAEQDRRQVPRAFEWLHERDPGLGDVLRSAGLPVVLHPLLVARPGARGAGRGDLRVRVVAHDDPALAAGAVVAEIGFANPGTLAGTVGGRERDESLQARDAAADAYARTRVAAGLTVVVVAEDDTGVLGVGSHQPVGGATEIVGVATLPSARRRGVAAAVTARLLADAWERGLELCLLSAGGEDVARVYERVGFTRIGHAGAAPP